MDDNGNFYSFNNVNVIYSVLNASHLDDSTLVDRGANGALVGTDVRIITKTTRSVDVRGFDKWQNIKENDRKGPN